MQETVDGKSINLRRKLFEQKERKQKISNPHPLHREHYLPIKSTFQRKRKRNRGRQNCANDSK